MEKEKTAIILVGGGMKSAHGAGFMHALTKEMRLRSPDIMIGSSGDAGNAVYCAAGQYDLLEHIWCGLLSTPEFISFARPWRMMDVDYLIDEIFKRQAPLNVNALQKSSVQWLIPVTDFDSGKTRYLGGEDNMDVFEILRAAKAIPFLFGKKVPLAHRRYIDGEFGPVLQDHLEQTFSRGARRVLVINHLSPWTERRRLQAHAYSLLTPPGMQKAIARDISTDVTHFSAPHANVLLVNPSGLAASTATRSKEKLQKTFEQGVLHALALESELRTLFDV